MAKTKTKSRDDGGSMKRVVRVRYASSFRYADVLELYVEDQAFRQAVDSGRYALVDDKIVLNASKYIDYIDGHMELRSTIKDEDEYYCLHYRCEIEYSHGTGMHWGMRACKPGVHRRANRAWRPSKRTSIKSKLEDAKRINSVNDVSLENILAIVGGGHGPGENFSEALTRFMKESDVTEEELSELTGLAPKTIQRMRNPNLRTSLKSVVAVCVALSLDLYNSMYLVHLAGFELTNSREDKVYYFILGFAYKETVYDCNRMLERLHMKPLTKL